LCLGYPFHPPGKPAQLRTAHLAGLATPTLICQGTRDEFGTRDEVAGYALSDPIEILWLEDGGHDLKPRKRVSGLTAADHLRTLERPQPALPAEQVVRHIRAAAVVGHLGLAGPQAEGVGPDLDQPQPHLGADRAVAFAGAGGDVQIRLEPHRAAMAAAAVGL